MNNSNIHFFNSLKISSIEIVSIRCKHPRNPDNLKVEEKLLNLNCQHEKKPVYRIANYFNAQGA